MGRKDFGIVLFDACWGGGKQVVIFLGCITRKKRVRFGSDDQVDSFGHF